MENIKVGILARSIVMSGQRWTDEDQAIDYIEVEVSDISNLFLSKLQLRTTTELFSFSGSIGSYTLIAKLDAFYLFARGDLSKIFTS
jgi:hypothetical protein